MFVLGMWRSHSAFPSRWRSVVWAFQIPIAAFTPARKSGRSLRRLPVASAIALATAAAAGPWPASPQPRNGSPARSTMWTSTLSGTASKRRIGYFDQSTDAARVVEADLLIEGPAQRLQDCAFDLVADTAGVDDLSGIHGSHDALDSDAPGLVLDGDLYGNGAIRREILVAGEGKPAAGSRPFAAAAAVAPARPSEPLRRRGDDIACAGVLEMPEPELHRVGPGAQRKLIHEALDGEHIHVRTE